MQLALSSFTGERLAVIDQVRFPRATGDPYRAMTRAVLLTGKGEPRPRGEGCEPHANSA
jgi:hypothetical protein